MDIEKSEVKHEPNISTAYASQYSENEEKQITRKIDFRLIPPLTMLYIISFLDRSNIGNAKVAGMEEDLQLTSVQYNITLSLFFVPYIIFEIPCNIILKIMRPSTWISSITVAWGVVMTLMGLVTNHQGLYVARMFLGLAEAGFFPGATFLLTLWYKRYEVQTRMSFFYAGSSLAGAFSGLLAYAIQYMDGIAGLGGLEVDFHLEGILAVLVGFTMFKLLPDDSSRAKFLTAEEKLFVVGRLQDETGTGVGVVETTDKMSRERIINGLKDWKVYLGVLVWWNYSCGAYGFSFTVPSVVNGLGYTAANAQLVTVPIYICAMLTTIAVSVASDHYKTKSPFILLAISTSIIGLIALLAVPHPAYPGLTYAFLFIATSGFYASVVPTISWVANNTAPSSKRAVAMAALSTGGNLGGIVGSNIFLGNQAPHYWTGYGVCLGVSILSGIATLAMRLLLKQENERRDALLTSDNAADTNEHIGQIGDESRYFRYTL